MDKIQVSSQNPQSPFPAERSRDSSKSDRRRGFLEKCLIFFSGIGILSMLYPVLRYIEPPPRIEGADRVEFDMNELPAGSARTVIYRGRPAVVVHGPDGFIAYSAVCPHLGCVVKWAGADQEFQCPCHGGRFNIKGEKTGGPVPGPLTPIKVAVSAEKVYIGG